MSVPVQQLNSIHAMLAAGHRNLRIERHSLLLWGISGGALLAVSDLILRPQEWPDVTQRALAWLAVLVVVMGGAGLIDLLWTRRVKAARDEAWSFIHRQVIKIWWLLMTMATLLTFASFFFGGGYMVCSIWLVAIGLGLYIHGLFSEELLEWIGGLIILIGIAALASQLNWQDMRWIAASVFAIGLPLLAAMLDRGRHRNARQRLAQTLGWLLAVTLLPLLLHQRTARAAPPDITPLSLADFRQRGAPAGKALVTLPAGTAIPVEAELSGEIFAKNGPDPVLPLTLAEPITLALEDGKLTGDVRLADGTWQPAGEVRWISIPWLRAELTPEKGPVVRGSLIVQIRKH